jgi:hypothetical protein
VIPSIGALLAFAGAVAAFGQENTPTPVGVFPSDDSAPVVNTNPSPNIGTPNQVPEQIPEPINGGAVEPVAKPQPRPTFAKPARKKKADALVWVNKKPNREAPPAENRWSVVLGIGKTISPTTVMGNITFAGNTKVQSVSQKDNSGTALSFEIKRELMDYFQLGVVLDWSKYNYADGTPSDSEIGLFIFPRVEAYSGPFIFWGALGGGLMTNVFGVTAVTTNGVTLTLTNPVLTFAYSPRAGIDYELGNTWLLGLQGTYTRTSGSQTFSISGLPSNSSSGFTQEFSRYWYAFAIRLGARF